MLWKVTVVSWNGTLWRMDIFLLLECRSKNIDFDQMNQNSKS